jgi:hypothetical protein
MARLEAVPFVPTSPGAQFCGSPFGLDTVSTYPSCRRKRHFGRSDLGSLHLTKQEFFRSI